MSLYQRNPYGGQQQTRSPWGGSTRRRSMGGGLIIAVVLAGFALCKYYSSSQMNEITGKKQHISITPDQEIALGLESTPYMIEQFGGLHPDPEGQKMVKEIGQRIVQNSDAKNTPYQYDFHLLADPNVVNAFA